MRRICQSFISFGVILGILAISILASSVSSADSVWILNGSRIVGTVKTITENKVLIETEFAGTLEVDFKKVQAIDTDSAVGVAFKSGDQLVGRIDMTPDQNTSEMQTTFGTIGIQIENMTALWPADEDNPQVVALKKQAEAAKEAAKPDWSARLEAGITRADGNKDTLDARGRARLTRKSPNELLQFYASGDYSETEDERSKNEIMGGILYENNLTDRLYWYSRVQMEYDEFEDLDLRATAAAGLGYYWIKQPGHEFKTRLGVGYLHESYDSSGDSEDDLVLDLGWDYLVDIMKWAQFEHHGLFSPNTDDFADHRVDLDTALLIPLDSEKYWKLKMGMRNEFNSKPVDDLDEWDHTYYANIVLDFDWK